MKSKNLASTVCSVLVISMLFAACSTGGSSSKAATAESAAASTADASKAANQAASASATSKKYAIVLRSTGNPYCEKEGDGFKDSVAKLGAEVIVKAPDQPTAEGQIAMVEELIAQKVDGIAIASNDIDGLQPVLTKAMGKGIHVVSLDSTVNKDSRETHVNQADTVAIGKTLVEAAYDMMGGKGEFAILSATSQAANQNAWIAQMQETLKDAKYKDMKLDKIAYGDDQRDKSTTETEGLIKTYPNLNCIVSPTTVGIAAAAKVLVDKKLTDKIKITGLGLPSEMSDYIEKGVCPYMYLWNPSDVGSLAAYTLDSIVQGKITGKTGDTFTAGDLGDKKVTAAADGGTEVLLGDPFKFDKSNIAQWKTVY
jgi:rhamnose transport system substrate-binding protein